MDTVDLVTPLEEETRIFPLLRNRNLQGRWHMSMLSGCARDNA